jgi:hypothetical protein
MRVSQCSTLPNERAQKHDNSDKVSWANLFSNW